MAQIFEGQIRFGVHAGPQHTSYANYLELWKTAEALGYDWASVFDHFIPIQSDPHGPCFEGPTVVVYPEGTWYTGVRPEDAAEIGERHMAGGEPVARLKNATWGEPPR